MQTLHRIYADLEVATQAVERVVALGFPREAIHIFGAPRNAHGGSFADSGPHDHTPERDHVGSFADSGPHDHTAERDHMGSFADSGPHDHTAERDHMGSFADVDRGPSAPEPIVSELVATGLSPDDAEAAGRRLVTGSVLVLVRVHDEQVAAVRGILGLER